MNEKAIQELLSRFSDFLNIVAERDLIDLNKEEAELIYKALSLMFLFEAKVIKQ